MSKNRAPRSAQNDRFCQTHEDSNLDYYLTDAQCEEQAVHCGHKVQKKYCACSGATQTEEYDPSWFTYCDGDNIGVGLPSQEDIENANLKLGCASTQTIGDYESQTVLKSKCALTQSSSKVATCPNNANWQAENGIESNLSSNYSTEPSNVCSEVQFSCLASCRPSQEFQPHSQAASIKPSMTTQPCSKQASAKPSIVSQACSKQVSSKPSIVSQACSKQASAKPSIAAQPCSKQASANPSTTSQACSAQVSAKPSTTRQPGSKITSAKPSAVLQSGSKVPSAKPSAALQPDSKIVLTKSLITTQPSIASQSVMKEESASTDSKSAHKPESTASRAPEDGNNNVTASSIKFEKQQSSTPDDEGNLPLTEEPTPQHVEKARSKSESNLAPPVASTKAIPQRRIKSDTLVRVGRVQNKIDLAVINSQSRQSLHQTLSHTLKPGISGLREYISARSIAKQKKEKETAQQEPKEFIDHFIDCDGMRYIGILEQIQLDFEERCKALLLQAKPNSKKAAKTLRIRLAGIAEVVPEVQEKLLAEIDFPKLFEKEIKYLSINYKPKVSAMEKIHNYGIEMLEYWSQQIVENKSVDPNEIYEAGTQMIAELMGQIFSLLVKSCEFLIEIGQDTKKYRKKYATEPLIQLFYSIRKLISEEIGAIGETCGQVMMRIPNLKRDKVISVMSDLYRQINFAETCLSRGLLAMIPLILFYDFQLSILHEAPEE